MFGLAQYATDDTCEDDDFREDHGMRCHLRNLSWAKACLRLEVWSCTLSCGLGKVASNPPQHRALKQPSLSGPQRNRKIFNKIVTIVDEYGKAVFIVRLDMTMIVMALSTDHVNTINSRFGCSTSTSSAQLRLYRLSHAGLTHPKC